MKVLILSALVILSVVASTQAGCGCRPTSLVKRDFDSFGNPQMEVFGEDMKMELRSASGDEKLVDGDQVFVNKDFAAFSGFRASVNERMRWPRNTIPYMFAGLSGSDQRKVDNALATLTRKTNNCVKFQKIRRSPSNGGYVSVFAAGGCYSYIGNLNRKQDLSLGRGCLGEETIQHEFMHALGFYHEQSRPDRDSYVKVNWQNINSATCGNFNKCRGCKTTTSYDIKSIMQYQGDAFGCKWGMKTMEDKRNPRNPIVRNRMLTQNDIKKIRDYYGC